jgi:hypothetical protein
MEKDIMQGCTYEKYYLKIFFILENKIHLYKIFLKTIIDESEKLHKN